MPGKTYVKTIDLIKDSKFIDLHIPDEGSDEFNPDQGDSLLLQFKNENGGIIKMLSNELYIHADPDETNQDLSFKKLLTDNEFVLDKVVNFQKRVFSYCTMKFSYEEYSHKYDQEIKIGLFHNHDGTSGGTSIMFMNELGVKFIQNRFQQLSV